MNETQSRCRAEETRSILAKHNHASRMIAWANAFENGYILRKLLRRDIRMSRTVGRWLWVGLGMLLTATPLLAHHNITGKFDPSKTRTLKGVVTKLDWANPHVHVVIDVLDGKTVTNWAVELESTLDLESSGWKLNTLKP